MQKRISLSIDAELNDLWGKIAKKHGLSKSGMVEEFLGGVLPILDESTPSKMMSKAMKKMAESIDDTASLFDGKQYDEDIEKYKKKKRG